MRAAERRERDERVVEMFLAGNSYRDIAAAVGLRSPTSVGNIVRVGLDGGDAARRRDLLTGNAAAVWVERSEALWASQFARAEAGDVRAATLCVRLLDRHARFYGLGADVPLPAPTPTLAHDDDDQDDNDDDLSRLRAKRHRTGGSS